MCCIVESMTQSTGKAHQATVAPGKYDVNALAVGQAVLRDTDAADVILFGSRARGDYHKDSDVDILLVHTNRQNDEIRSKAYCAADAAVKTLYGMFLPVDFVWFTPKEFERLRRSVNSVAAIATEEGITMDGQPAGDEYPNDDEDYSSEWDMTEQRCYHAKSHLHTLRVVIDNHGTGIMVSQQAHQTLEHAMKALISARIRRYPHHHNLVDLEDYMRRADRGFTDLLESPLEALNDYGGGLKYDGPYAALGDRNELYQKVLNDTRQIFRRVAFLTGKDPWQEQPEDQ